MCPKTGVLLRIEYGEKLTGYCDRCLSHHLFCGASKEMMFCMRPPGHEGKHAYREAGFLKRVTEWSDE